MEAVSRMASAKQVEFLEDLSKRAEVELERPAESLTAQQASAKIDELLEQIDQLGGKRKSKMQGANPRTRAEKRGQLPNRSAEISRQARFGMVCKIAMQRWLDQGVCPTEKKEQFGKWVIKLYNLANEIADAALQQQKASY